MSKCKKINVGGTIFNIDVDTIPRYATSSTGASTAAKTATTADQDFKLTEGATVKVLFSSANTATTPTLNVDDTGAKTIYGYDTTKPSLWWKAGDVVEFTYNGTNWIMKPTQGQISDLSHRIIATITPSSGETYATMGRKIGDAVHQLDSALLPSLKLVLGGGDGDFSSAGNIYRLGRASHTIGYYSFNAVEYGNTLVNYECRITGSASPVLFRDLSFNNGTWTLADATSAACNSNAYLFI